MKRSRPLGRGTPLRRSGGLRRTGRIKPVSEAQQEKNWERRRVLEATYSRYPDCVLCPVLRAAGIVTGCSGRASDGDEILRRSAGGSITDPANVRPVGRECHRWVTEHPERARELGLVQSRFGGDPP